MISSISSIIVAIILLSILVIAHEFGHFIVAKKSGILVEEFAVGMGPKLISHQFGETVYSLRLFPLGGFCRMLGEDQDCHDERSFQEKSLWKRAAVVVAGPIMNFILAGVFFFGLAATTYIMLPQVSLLTEGYPAQQVGIQLGDRIIKLDGKMVGLFEDVELIMREADGSPMEVEVIRQGQKLAFSITPMLSTEDGTYKIGFIPTVRNGMFSKDVDGYEKASFMDTLRYTGDSLVFYTRHMAEGLGRLFTFQVSKEEVAGPIGIFQVVGEGYQEGLKHSVAAAIQNLAYLGAILSVNLGLLNLFPVPALDGGRLLFIIIEAVRRKPMNPELEGKVHFTGFMLLMLLMLYIAFNDVSKIFMG
ncbi:MAG: site-2 protease family protein [Epulopiscium sp.]|jgi:regulator of sigma E protease|nr:site-2 protease family protein [Candidatus Epulonipiscium sp.]